MRLEPRTSTHMAKCILRLTRVSTIDDGGHCLTTGTNIFHWELPSISGFRRHDQPKVQPRYNLWTVRNAFMITSW